MLMKPGRPANYVRDGNGHFVNDLFIQKAKRKDGREYDRYFALADGKRKYFGNSDDKAAAILAFQQWQAQEQDAVVTFATERLAPQEVDEKLAAAMRRHEIEVTVDLDGSIEVADCVQEDAIWAWCSDRIRRNPLLAAQKTGIEQLGYLHRLEPPLPPATLEEVGKLYLDDKKDELTPKEWKNCEAVERYYFNGVSR
jgi:hypothetical protein